MLGVSTNDRSFTKTQYMSRGVLEQMKVRDFGKVNNIIHISKKMAGKGNIVGDDRLIS